MVNSKTCLLIDDDLDDQEIFLIALDKSGKNVKCNTANNAIQGLKQLDENPVNIPDFIFMDLNMPGMNGRQCLVEIKSRPFLKHVPVIVYTTTSQPADIHEMKALGATDFISKPPSLKLLTELLSDFFDNYS